MGLLSRIETALTASLLVNVTSPDAPSLDLRTLPAAFVKPAGRQAEGPRGRDVCDVYVLNAVARDPTRYEDIEDLQDAILEVLRTRVTDCYPDQSPTAALEQYAPVEGGRQRYSGFMVECVGGV